MTQLSQLKEIAQGKDDDKWRATFHRGTALTLIECLEMAMKGLHGHRLREVRMSGVQLNWCDVLHDDITAKLKELHHDE